MKTQYHKGTQYSGGGGHKGGGGKKGRPRQGWEKGDMVRNIDDSDSPFQVRAKPGARKKLYQLSDVERRTKIQNARSLAKSAKKILPVTIRAAEFNLNAWVRRDFADRLVTFLGRFEKVIGAIVTFERMPDGSVPTYEVLCTIKVKLWKLEHATIEFGGRDLEEAFEGALKRLPTMIRESYAAVARRVRRRQGEPVSRRFHRARIVGHV